MANFQDAISHVLGHEGGYSESPGDAGGATKYGISLRFFRKKFNPNATAQDIKFLSKEEAIRIYDIYFWQPQQYALINNQQLANKVFDLSVNCGSSYANAFLQRAINKVYEKAHLVIDGQMGDKTIEAANAIMRQDDLYVALLEYADKYYRDIAKINTNEKFLKGWENRLYSV